MANYPFRINIVDKSGHKVAYYTASLATDADTTVSSSVMVTRINAMKAASSFIESIEAPSLTSTNYNNTNEGIKFLSASVTHPNTGSVVFTDTEETDLGGESILLETGGDEYIIQETYIIGNRDSSDTLVKDAQNELFDALDDTVLDFSETNPFGDAGGT